MTPWVSDLSFATKEGVLTFAMGLSGRNHYETLPLWSITECTEEQPKITQRFIYSIRRTSLLPAHIRNDIKGFMPSYFKIKVNVIGDTINPQSVSLLPRHSLLIAYENAWSFFHLVGLTRHRDPPPPRCAVEGEEGWEKERRSWSPSKKVLIWWLRFSFIPTLRLFLPAVKWKGWTWLFEGWIWIKIEIKLQLKP